VPYCASDDVRAIWDAERVKEALDADGDQLPDPGVLAKHLRWAEGKVYAYISHRYPSYRPSLQTAAGTTAHINEQCAILAAYSALGRNGRLIQRRYDQALDDLTEVREGRNNLDGVSAENIADSVRKDELRVFREKDAAVSDHGEPAPGQTSGTDDNGFWDRPT
jgi:phage gp36-like protein